MLASVAGEYRRYKELAEKAFEQTAEEDLTSAPHAGDNSIAILVWHVSGNLKSRFTDFLTTDGEKPWRDRESEFDARAVTHAKLRRKWQAGWGVLFEALGALSDTDLDRKVTIRGQELTVIEALHRSLAHTAYHVGQIVYLAKSLRGEAWRSLSIPRRK